MLAERFKTWCLAYSGCDGGDIGSQEQQSVWVCGIEWGGGHSPESLQAHMAEDVSRPPSGYERWEENVAYHYNRQVMKLLAVMNGDGFETYREFAESRAPFVAGQVGFFKLNLYPVGFKDTSESRWHEGFKAVTGFATKKAYLDWCWQVRLPVMQGWVDKHRPKAIICLGKTYANDFYRAFYGSIPSDAQHEVIEGTDIQWVLDDAGTLIVILPFMANPHGLVRNAAIQRVGERIAELMLV